MNIIISSIDIAFHFLKREWGGNSGFACMYWAANIFFWAVRRLENVSSRKESIK